MTCDSYTPSSSLSVRWIVASGYWARTACSTWVLVSPVSSCSLPWWDCDGSWSVWVVELPGVVSSAALAVSVLATIPPATTPAATRPAPPAHFCHLGLLLISPPGLPPRCGRLGRTLSVDPEAT